MSVCVRVSLHASTSKQIMTNRRIVAVASFINAGSSTVGFIGYSAAPRLGEPYTSIGYLAFVVWSVALLPIVLHFYSASDTASNRTRLATLSVGLSVIASGVILQTLLFLRVVTPEQTTAWNFASAGGVGLWLILSHSQNKGDLPRGLAWLGIMIGITWITAFVLLGALGFPAGGSKGSWVAAIGFGADATAYFASIGWAIWLAVTLLRALERAP